MGIYSRSTPYLALVGMLVLGAPSALRAQEPTSAPKDTSAAAPSDTGAYQGYQRTDSAADTTSKAGEGGYKYTGPPSDTALKAKPGVQTGPTSGKTDSTTQAAGVAAAADTVVCKDGSNAAREGGNACASHGGVDWAATKSALKARGKMVGDSTGAPADTSSSTDSSSSQSQKP
jgi:hypothetical protein